MLIQQHDMKEGKAEVSSLPLSTGPIILLEMGIDDNRLVCAVCHGISFRETDSGELVCTQCGTISEVLSTAIA